MNFPDELNLFRERTTDPGYRALILLGTRQATTAALLIGTLKLERVAFLLTNDTRTMPQQVADLLGVSADAWLCPNADHSTTTQVYKGVKAILEAWQDLSPHEIAVDVTGGYKPMSVGLEKAAHLLQLGTLYIESDYGKLPDGRFGPVAGTQRLVIPPDPYTVFGDIEAAEARRLFAGFDYVGAQRIFAELAGRVPDAAGAGYAALAELAALYAAWDVLDFAEAARHADQLLAMPLDDIPQLADHQPVLRQQQQLLHTLTLVSSSVSGNSIKEKIQTLANAKAMLPLLGTLHAAALRRAAQGRYDFAALFRYRCLELISQHRLASHGIFTNGPKFENLGERKTQVSANFVQVQKNLGRKEPRGLGKLRSVAMFDGYMLLAALEDLLVEGFAIKQIEERSKARNQSVLAHGYRLISQNEYAQFAEVVEEVIDHLFTQVLQQPRDAWERQVGFVDPFGAS